MGYHIQHDPDTPDTRPCNPENAWPGFFMQDVGQRFYSPGLGRWLNRDPIGEWGGENLQQFVYNNPLSWSDDVGERPRRDPPCPPATCPPANRSMPRYPTPSSGGHVPGTRPGGGLVTPPPVLTSTPGVAGRAFVAILDWAVASTEAQVIDRGLAACRAQSPPPPFPAPVPPGDPPEYRPLYCPHCCVIHAIRQHARPPDGGSFLYIYTFVAAEVVDKPCATLPKAASLVRPGHTAVEFRYQNW